MIVEIRLLNNKRLKTKNHERVHLGQNRLDVLDLFVTNFLHKKEIEVIICLNLIILLFVLLYLFINIFKAILILKPAFERSLEFLDSFLCVDWVTIYFNKFNVIILGSRRYFETTHFAKLLVVFYNRMNVNRVLKNILIKHLDASELCVFCWDVFKFFLI